MSIIFGLRENVSYACEACQLIKIPEIRVIVSLS